MNNNSMIPVLFALLAGFSIGTAEAFVAQDPGKALSFNNIAREGEKDSSSYISPKAKDKNSSMSSGSIFMNKASQDESKAYHQDTKSLTEKFFGTPPEEKISLNMESGDLRNVKLPRDYVLEVKLPEAENTFWRIDTDEAIVQPLSSRLEEGLRIIEFRAMKPGTAKIFLDNIADKDSKAATEASRIIRIKVTK